MSEQGKTEGEKINFHWPWVLWCIYLYILGVYGIYQLITCSMWFTIIYAIMIMLFGSLGLTIGAHRLWAHRTYDAEWYIKLMLMFAHTLTGVGSIYDWVLAHRIHHKFHGTDKDPYNHNRGFLYSHIISNFSKKSADYDKLAKVIDMRDMESDIYVWFQNKFYIPLFIIFGLLLPINAPAEYWGESIVTSFFVIGFLRLAVLLNISWLINSATHIWSLKPQDKYPPEDNLVFLINRSYWLNYHYVIPWDWKSGEFGTYNSGFSTSIINIFERIGLVKDLKTASDENIREALFSLASTKKTATEVFEDVKKAAEYDSARAELEYHH
ncbi:hypothetical protein PV328_002882 [Microctonus aethiopoides]|uniref:Acyl-CoA desaturase n=1 Tax=Microctonus aethiopoides TaxID=144406 RepID=A0AA39KK28_9HYME|nr:hypothetical protein PV328_002882 [Microctonus aethiopoides]